ncbi:MAG TPA: GAF domain-containing protein [Methylomirabilota bacterium]|jgi:putative methionine-R-sulfoxide reductase with GAF domain|nr:GAF domain-containing protein [Methylomirabilota bacterium]
MKPMADLQKALTEDLGGIPFRTELSLKPVIDFWTRMAGEDSAKGAVARVIAEQVARVPELLGPLTDCSVVERHQDILDLLMAAAFPPALAEHGYGAAMVPMQLHGFYATPPMERLLMTEDWRLKGRINLDTKMVAAMRRAYAYALVLHKVYGVDLELETPLILTVPDPETGLDRHFRLLFDWTFVDVEVTGPKPELPDNACQRFQADLLNAEGLGDLLPSDRFLLRGFTILKALEVTDQEVLSALKRDLIDRESIVSKERFCGVEMRLRTLFRRPNLKLGIGAIDGERVLILNDFSSHEHACIFADSAHHKVSEFTGTVYMRAVKDGRPLIVEDLAAMPNRTPVEDSVLASGIRTLVVVPLHYQDRVIGTLELGSSEPDDLDATHLPKIHELAPLFAMAVRRSMDEFNARVQTEIKERFTAIHPVVEWRFRKAVLDGLERTGDPGAAELSPIVFENVYPLYALSDIRGSSVQRERAIQADLLAQLALARDVIDAAYAARRLPALDQLRYRIDRHAEQIREGVAAGDEVGIISFLRAEVESLFEHLTGFGDDPRATIDAYRAALDARLGAVYRQRRVFEESVTRIADMISSYLDLEEQAAQDIFPHYFEKQKTDGVDHQIYVGGSLIEDGGFDPIYLKSLRLWQLMVACGIAARADRLTADLPVPLHTTHLVLVQHMPMSIRFRFDEKRFDVDGAYDIRYEIVKKRIDKAVIKGSTERVTQPGKLAIVYGQPGEAAEYRGYLEYLRHLGYVGGEVEELELEELQGVHGLRALRVTVTLRDAPAVPAAAQALRATAGR